MTVNKGIVAKKIFAYLNHKITLESLVDWAENAIMKGNIEDKDIDSLMSVLTKLGVADVRSFGLTWEECQAMMHELGYSLKVNMSEEL